MRKNATPEFDAKWWDTNQPKGLTKGKALSSALDDYKSAKDKLAKSGSEDDVRPAVIAMGKVRQAVEAVISEADKMKKAPPKGADADDLGNTVDALKKFNRLFDSEKAELDKLVKEDEDDDNVFKDPDGYRKYLLKGLRKVPGATLNFGLVLGKKGGDHRLALSKTKGPQGLGRQVMEATGIHIMTFGTMTEDDQRDGFLKLNVEGKQLPGLKKKVDRMLKTFKPLPYTHVVLLVNGEEVDDIADPDDTDTDDDAPQSQGQATQGQTTDQQQSGGQPQETLGQLRAIMEKILPTLRQLITANGPGSAEMAKLAGQFQQQLRGFDAAGAKATIDALVALMRTGAGSNSAYGQLVEEWNAARTRAANDIKSLQAAIVAEFKAAPELPEIQKNLTVLDKIMATLGTALQDRMAAAQNAPADQRPQMHKDVLNEVKSYQTYIATDELVSAVQDNPFTKVDLRGTLTPALQKIEKALAA